MKLFAALAVLVAAMMTLTGAAVLFEGTSSADPVHSGVYSSFDQDFLWEISSDGTLTITGALKDLSLDDALPFPPPETKIDFTSVPWYSYRLSIDKVVLDVHSISGGIFSDKFYQTSAGYVFTSVECTSAVKEIRAGAFYGCDTLVSFSAPAVQTIYLESFSGCTSLQTVDIPDCREIYDHAFKDCTGIVDLYVSYSNFVQWDSTAFEGAAVQNVIFSSNYIGSQTVTFMMFVFNNWSFEGGIEDSMQSITIDCSFVKLQFPPALESGTGKQIILTENALGSTGGNYYDPVLGVWLEGDARAGHTYTPDWVGGTVNAIVWAALPDVVPVTGDDGSGDDSGDDSGDSDTGDDSYIQEIGPVLPDTDWLYGWFYLGLLVVFLIVLYAIVHSFRRRH